MDNYAEETTPGFATTYRGASASSATVSLPTAKKNNSSLDNHIAPPFFFGKSTEDAFDFINYVEKFAAYKEMSGDEKVKFVAVLLRDAAADLFDTLAATTTTSGSDDDDQEPSHPTTWEQFREAFLQRFGRLQATSWRDVQQLFANPQRIDETASNFISRLTRIAKRVENIDDRVLQHAIVAGLKPELRTHVIQSQTSSLDDLIQSARVADAAVTSTTNPALSQVLAELKTNNDLHARHDAAFQQLKERLDKLHVSAVDNNTVNDEQRRRVRFSTPPRSRSPSPGGYKFDNSRQHDVATEHRTKTPDDVTGVVLFVVIISVRLQKLSVIVATVSVIFKLSVAVADVLIIMNEDTPLPSIETAAEEPTYK